MEGLQRPRLVDFLPEEIIAGAITEVIIEMRRKE